MAMNSRTFLTEPQFPSRRGDGTHGSELQLITKNYYICHRVRSRATIEVNGVYVPIPQRIGAGILSDGIQVILILRGKLFRNS